MDQLTGGTGSESRDVSMVLFTGGHFALFIPPFDVTTTLLLSRHPSWRSTP